jgi:hypothetical protein
VDKDKVLKMIDDHKNKLINPVEMLDWTWLRVIILKIEADEWEELVGRAVETMSK